MTASRANRRALLRSDDVRGWQRAVTIILLAALYLELYWVGVMKLWRWLTGS